MRLLQHLYVVVDRVNAISVLAHEIIGAAAAVRAAYLAVWTAPVPARDEGIS